MTTEQPPPWAQEHRRSRWWPFDSGLGRLGRSQPFEPAAPDDGPATAGPGPATAGPGPAAAGPGAAAAGPGPADTAQPTENGSVIHGEVVSDDQRAAREAAQRQEQVAAERLPLHPNLLQELRMQLADVAERAHQKRLDPDGHEPLGQGGGVTAEVVRAIAEAISAQRLPGPAGSDEDRALLLFGALAATDPQPVADAGHVSFVTSRGRLMLDVSTAAIDGDSLSTRFVRLPSRSEPAEQGTAGQGAAGQGAGEPGAGEQDAADRSTAASQGDAELPARYAAVICGPAAVIAGGRPFLGLDTLTTYARRQAFLRSSEDGVLHAARNGMRAAHSIEIVVLLDQSLGGGVWVDVDPATGCPVAAMSIALKSEGFRFRRLVAA